MVLVTADNATKHCTNKLYGRKWDNFKDAVTSLNEVNANYAVSSGTLLFYYRDCSVGDLDLDFMVDYDWFLGHSHELHEGLQYLLLSGQKSNHQY